MRRAPGLPGQPVLRADGRPVRLSYEGLQMRRLVLMRHAKSSWGDPGLDDHDRPLNKRGKQSAKALGDWLRAQTIVVDQALVSSSVRTVETMQRLKVDCDRQVLD